MNIYISITSIYQKQQYLLQTLTSIKEQTQKFDHCYIYLSEYPYLFDCGFRDRIITNKKLYLFLKYNSDLFSVIWTENTGPYRKLLPLLTDKQKEDCIIITADDDTVYDKNMIFEYINQFYVFLDSMIAFFTTLIIF